MGEEEHVWGLGTPECRPGHPDFEPPGGVLSRLLGKSPTGSCQMWESPHFKSKQLSEADVLKVPPIFLHERLGLNVGEPRCPEEETESQ